MLFGNMLKQIKNAENYLIQAVMAMKENFESVETDDLIPTKDNSKRKSESKGTQTTAVPNDLASISEAEMFTMNLHMFRPPIDEELWQDLLQEVAQAVKLRKVFSIYGICPGLAEELEARNWVQKLYPSQKRKCSSSNVDDTKRNLLSDILKHVSPNFLWLDKKTTFFFKPDYYYNKISRTEPFDFTSKIALAKIWDNIRWFDEDNANSAKFFCPRSFILDNVFEREAFRDDFRLTVYLSFLTYLIGLYNMKEIFCKKSQHKVDCLDFAIHYVRSAIDAKEHNDIDCPVYHSKIVYPPVFTDNYRKIYMQVMDRTAKIELDDAVQIERYLSDIRMMAPKIREHFPYAKDDGNCNLWIVKSSNSHCGNMMKIFNNEIAIHSHVEQFSTKTFIVQKYIERPLLIHNTKFDVRQYFMVSMDLDTFNVWFYRNCYLKLSGTEYDLNDFSEQIHITNHTVQRKYQPDSDRAPELPAHNMMIQEEFQEYLKSIGAETMWSERIYPGMVNCIRSIVKASFDDLTYVKYNFELYGADFMMTEDFYPILIEINAIPDLRHSTESTRIVNTELVEDLVKVIVDLPNNKSIDTGNFENILTYKMPLMPPNNSNFMIVGQNLDTMKKLHPPASKSSVCSPVSLSQGHRKNRVPVDRKLVRTASLSERPLVPSVASKSMNSTQSAQTGRRKRKVERPTTATDIMEEYIKVQRINRPFKFM